MHPRPTAFGPRLLTADNLLAKRPINASSPSPNLRGWRLVVEWGDGSRQRPPGCTRRPLARPSTRWRGL